MDFSKAASELLIFRSEKVSAKMPPSIAEAISMQQFKTSVFSNISVADMMAARHDLATINKVCQASSDHNFFRLNPSFRSREKGLSSFSFQ